MKETEIQAQILQYLELVPRCHAWRANSGQRGRVRINEPGCADIIVCLRGTFIAFEVKGEHGQQTEDQIKWQAAIEAAGGRYFLVRSMHEAQAAIEQLTREPVSC